MDKYLLEILKESNTIIIPGLGALTITNKETGETMFMPYLQHDDGKLAAFISEKDGIDEADAKNMVAKYVREIQTELDKGESYSMFGLGEFMKADDGDIEFSHSRNSELASAKSEKPAIEVPFVVNELSDEVPTDTEISEVEESEMEPINDELESSESLEEVNAEVEELVIDETAIDDAITEEPIAIVDEPTIDEVVSEEPIVIADEPIIEQEPLNEVIAESETIEEHIEQAVEESEINTNEPEIAIDEPEINATIGDASIDTTEEVATIEASLTEEIPEVIEIEEEIEPDFISEATTEANNLNIDEPEADILPEPIELSEDEIAIKNTIEEALESAPEIETVVTPKVSDEVISAKRMEPAAAMGGLIGDEPPVDENSEEAEEEEKEKPSARFWILMITLAIIIIGGGAYIGRNYNELKQHVPFLADDLEKDSLDTIDYKSQKLKSANDKSREYIPKTEKSELDESTAENGIEDGTAKPKTVEKQTTVEKPKVVEKSEVKKPRTTISSSSGGHYHIIAGAFSSVENANRLVTDFKKQGLSGASVVKNGELHAVSMQSYATSEQANADLNKMNRIASGAWILYK